MIKQMNLIFTEEDLKVLELCKQHKLSVSGVKYSKGHDADCMECNLKIGARIKAQAWDDSYGGGFQYDGEHVSEVETILKKIVEEAPKYTSKHIPELGEMEYSWDMIVDVLVKEFNNIKQCKKKTFVVAIKQPFPKDGKGGVPRTYEFTYKVPFNTQGITEEKILQDFEKDGYYAIQIVNKMYV